MGLFPVGMADDPNEGEGVVKLFFLFGDHDIVAASGGVGFPYFKFHMFAHKGLSYCLFTHLMHFPQQQRSVPKTRSICSRVGSQAHLQSLQW
jgi:hypothetical protein